MYNMSTLDGITRIFLTALWPAIFVSIGGPISWVGVIAVYFLVTGLGGYCPVYRMLGISTLEDPEVNSHDIHDNGSEISVRPNSMKSAA